jgi:S-DNA-T family DNA segregation ATPase FtsK/SpoIIIE
LWALVGVAGDELGPVGVDLAEGGGFVIAGPARSGRSTTLAVMGRSLLAGGGVEIVAVCPRPSPVRNLAGQPGVLAVLDGSPTPDALAAALRKASGPVVVLVDDAELFGRTDADAALREFLRGALPGSTAVVMAGLTDDLKNTLKGTIVDVRKAKAGLLLSPESTLDGELIGVRLPRNLIGRTPPGRGIVGLHGEAKVTQVPTL